MAATGRLLPPDIRPKGPGPQGFVPHDAAWRARLARRAELRTIAPRLWAGMRLPGAPMALVVVGSAMPRPRLDEAADLLGWPQEGRSFERSPRIDPRETVLVCTSAGAEPLPGRLLLRGASIQIDLIDPTTGGYP